MAVDKLVDSTQLDSDLTSIANAIRTKCGTSAQLAFPSDFVQAIQNISAGGWQSFINYASGVSIFPGYLNNTGAIAGQTADKEITTDYIDVSLFASRSISFFVFYPDTYSSWATFGLYDADKKFLSRTSSLAYTTPFGYANYTVPDTASYIRFSIRSKNNLIFAITDQSAINQIKTDLTNSLVSAGASSYYLV